MTERSLEMRETTYICFTEYEKAMDRVFHQEIVDCLETIDINHNDRNIIRNLHWNQSAVIRFLDDISEEFSIKLGVRQGYVLTLFNLNTELIFRERDDLSGCVIGGENTNNLSYADATALVAISEHKLHDL